MNGPGPEISRDFLPARLPPLGYVKIGRQKVAGDPGFKANARGKQPMKLDHFIVTHRGRGPDGNFVPWPEIMAKVGPRPRSLNIRLPFDTRRENLYAQMVDYTGQTRRVECDGERARNCETDVVDVCARVAGKRCGCKPYGRLSMILEDAPEFGGVFTYNTTSWEAVNGFQTTLDMLERQFGSLRGLPLKLRAYESETRYRGSDGATHTGTAWRVAVLLRADFETARAAALEYHRASELTRAEITRLAAGTAADLDRQDADNAAAIAGEFFPDRARMLAAGSGGGSEPTSPLGRINRAIVGGPGGDEPDDAPADEAPAESDPTDALIERVSDLVVRAAERGVITEKQVEGITAEITARNVDRLRLALDWLTDLTTSESGGDNGE